MKFSIKIILKNLKSIYIMSPVTFHLPSDKLSLENTTKTVTIHKNTILCGNILSHCLIVEQCMSKWSMDWHSTSNSIRMGRFLFNCPRVVKCTINSSLIWQWMTNCPMVGQYNSKYPMVGQSIPNWLIIGQHLSDCPRVVKYRKNSSLLWQFMSNCPMVNSVFLSDQPFFGHWCV